MELCVTPAGHDGPLVVAVTNDGNRGLVVQQAGETLAQLVARAERIATRV
jgi:hypothetical protein